ncbi:hypothetical protein QT237_13080 [Geobacillus stearothermophilus]|nr:hypothetical protein QT237_13080 [Geobacillus stearothermophilus]
MPTKPPPVLDAAVLAALDSNGSPHGDDAAAGGCPRENKRAKKPPGPLGPKGGAGMRANGAGGAPMNGEGIIGGRLYLMALMTVASFPLCG